MKKIKFGQLIEIYQIFNDLNLNDLEDSKLVKKVLDAYLASEKLYEEWRKAVNKAHEDRRKANLLELPAHSIAALDEIAERLVDIKELFTLKEVETIKSKLIKCTPKQYNALLALVK